MTLPRRALAALPLLVLPPALAADRRAATIAELAKLEARHGGRLGVAILGGASGEIIARRGEERFPICSTYKALAAAAVLARVDKGEERLDRVVRYTAKDLVTYSPVTEKQVATGMTVDAICAAAIEWSDNTAGNLLFDMVGGPAGLTAWLRTIGDEVTRLDRRETALNEAAPGDPRDTSTPNAMARTMQRLLLTDALSEQSRQRLEAWLVACKTGDTRLRAGTPAGWRVGDKTGSGAHNATNDIAIFRPPGRAPILVAAFSVDAAGTMATQSAVLADVGQLAISLAG